MNKYKKLMSFTAQSIPNQARNVKILYKTITRFGNWLSLKFFDVEDEKGYLDAFKELSGNEKKMWGRFNFAFSRFAAKRHSTSAQVQSIIFAAVIVAVIRGFAKQFVNYLQSNHVFIAVPLFFILYYLIYPYVFNYIRIKPFKKMDEEKCEEIYAEYEQCVEEFLVSGRIFELSKNEFYRELRDFLENYEPKK